MRMTGMWIILTLACAAVAPMVLVALAIMYTAFWGIIYASLMDAGDEWEGENDADPTDDP